MRFSFMVSPAPRSRVPAAPVSQGAAPAIKVPAASWDAPELPTAAPGGG